MKNFIIYDHEGKILRTGTCPSDMLSIQPGNNEIVMEGEADDSKHYIKNGEVVEHTEEMKKERKNKEVQREQFNYQQRLIDGKINEILRNQAIEELKKEGKL
jgi:hypothetical protein